jgi:hypothetical protein
MSKNLMSSPVKKRCNLLHTVKASSSWASVAATYSGTSERLVDVLRDDERLADQPLAMDEHEVDATGHDVHPQCH